MNTNEYLLECMKKEKISTWYKLSQKLDISQTELYYYRRGERLPSLYAYFKISECLGIDVSIIMADIASESEKNPKKREFFKSFMCNSAAATVLTVTDMFLIIGNGEEGSAVFDSHNVALCLSISAFNLLLWCKKKRPVSRARGEDFLSSLCY